MPIAAITPAVATLFAGGAAAGASIYGARSASSANRDAMRTEERYSDKALAAAEEQREYDRQQEAARIQREEEQRKYDRGMDERLLARDEERQSYGRGQYNQYLGRLEPFRASGSSALPRLESLLGNSPVGGAPMASGGGMVTLRAPNGQTQQVPATQAEHYERLGAVRV
jgi:hypothetical protein